MISTKLLTFAVGVGVVLFFSPSAVVAHSAKVEFAQLAQESGRIYSAKVERIECLPFSGVGIQTVATLTEVEWIAGSPEDKTSTTRTVRWLGGTLNGETVEACMTPHLVVGQRYVLFEEAAWENSEALAASPFYGAAQGMFLLQQDEKTNAEYLLSAGGKAVLGMAGTELILSPSENGSAKQSVTAVSSNPALLTISPIEKPDPKSLPRAMNLEQFADLIVQVRGNAEASPDAAPTTPFVPKAGQVAQPLVSADKGSVGGATGVCGSHQLPLLFQYADNGFSAPQIESLLADYNRFMDIYRIRINNGPYAFDNGRSEYHGELSDAEYTAAFGAVWGANTLAVCYNRRSAGDDPCRRIIESDIVLNLNFNFTGNVYDQFTNNQPFSFRAIMSHELGHSWGNQTGIFAETYDYPVPTVMHAGYRLLEPRGVWEDGFGIQPNDAMFIRQAYQNQTPIIDIRDVGVESYFANSGLNGGVISPTQFVLDGDSKSLNISAMTVVNNRATAEENVRVRFFLSPDFTITPGDYPLGVDAIISINPMAATSIFETQVNTFTPTKIPKGTYYVGAIVSRGGFGSDDYYANDTTIFRDRVTFIAPPDDILEENDSFAASVLVPVNDYLPSGNSPTRLYDEDWYKVVVPNGLDSLDIQCYFDREDGPLFLQLFDANGTLIDESNPEFDYTFAWSLGSGPGTYYFRVYSSAYTGMQYDIYPVAFEQSPNDGDEENDSFATAQALAQTDREKWLSTKFTSMLQADNDWYSFDVTDTENSLYIERYQIDFNGDTTLSLYDESENLIAQSVPTQGGNPNEDGGVEMINLVGTVAPGRYYILIAGSEEFTRYDLRFFVSSTIPVQPEEPNNLALDATDITWISAQWSGELLPPFTQTDDDFFIIRLPEGANGVLVSLRATTAMSPTLRAPLATVPGDVQFTLEDEAGNVLATSQDNAGTQEINLAPGLAEGDYYLHVTGDNSGVQYELNWAPQTIEVTLSDVWNFY